MKTILPLMIFLLSGCATLSGSEQLLGMSRTQLMACMSQTNAERHQDGQHILTFSGEHPEAMCPLKKLAGMQPKQRHCQLQVTLTNGQVVAVHYLNADGSEVQDASKCEFLLEKCLD